VVPAGSASWMTSSTVIMVDLAKIRHASRLTPGGPA
jgi:hypothetical protein